MTRPSLGGYTRKVLRVDLSNETLTEEYLDEAILHKWVGGVGLGAKYLYEEVPPGVEWLDAGNLLIFSSGPFGGTRVGGSGTVNVVTKGCLTDGATSSQANGFMGAYMKFSGYDAIVIKGIAPRWQYLYLHDGTAELRDASSLKGKDVWETERLIRNELKLSAHRASIYGIGPAGENLVKFAAIVGDHGHVMGHNGVGAVMGSKRLKAVAAARGNASLTVHNSKTVSALVKEMWEIMRESMPLGYEFYKWGTLADYKRAEARVTRGTLPVKNLTTTAFPEARFFSAEYLRSHHEVKRTPCWACRHHHVHRIKISHGPYSGLVAEEPEYEPAAAWGPLIGNTVPEAAVMLSDVADRLGLEANEAGWLTAMVIELFENGVLTTGETDGLEMRWGNVEAVRELLYKIARREGFGDLLADGVMRAARRLGKDALDCAVYINKGSTPATHDHRAWWGVMFDLATANTGNFESVGSLYPQEISIASSHSPSSPMYIASLTAQSKGRRQFEDCLGVCIFCTNVSLSKLVDVLNAITGWDMSCDEAREIGLRVSNILRAFNALHGITPQVEVPSKRYWSAPMDGPAEGKTIIPLWNEMLELYYDQMGWDRATGRPLPETLRQLGLEEVIKELWE